jgi:hypothetical protein
MVSFMPQPFSLRLRALQYSLDRRVGGLKRWSGHGGEKKKIPPLSLQGNEPQSSSP